MCVCVCLCVCVFVCFNIRANLEFTTDKNIGGRDDDDDDDEDDDDGDDDGFSELALVYVFMIVWLSRALYKLPPVRCTSCTSLK